MKDKILIIGTNGFVGSEILQFFLKKKIKVSYFFRLKKNRNSRSNLKKIKKLILDNDIIINCVGENINKHKMFQNNFIFIKKIIDFVNLIKKKKIFNTFKQCCSLWKIFSSKKL